jgi:hypothetical protein
MSILRGQLPWRKRQRPDLPSPASHVPLRSAMSAPSGGIESMTATQSAAEEANDGEWSLNGPYIFDRWRDMIERCAVLHSCRVVWCGLDKCLGPVSALPTRDKVP